MGLSGPLARPRIGKPPGRLIAKLASLSEVPRSICVRVFANKPSVAEAALTSPRRTGASH